MFSETKITVRYQETDQMGIVHHSVYPIWFECGRTELIRLAGVTYSEMEKEGVLLPLLGLQCCYRAPAFYEDEITIKSTVLDLKPTRIIFHYEVYRKGLDKPIASGETEHAWANRELKPVNFKKYKPQIYQMLMDVFINKGEAGHE